MDELEISGKRYISSKRAAKENRYHVDYIGQLIRAGKITGSKVGRSWYVEVESLDTYLDQEHTPSTSPIVAQNYVAPITRSTSQYSYVEKREAPVTFERDEFPQQEYQRRNEAPVQAIGGLRYISDDEPMLPLARSEHKIEIKTHHQEPRQVVDEPIYKAPTPTKRVAYAAPPLPPQNTKTLLYVAGFLGALAFVGAMSVSYYLQFDTVVEQANVYSSIHF